MCLYLPLITRPFERQVLYGSRRFHLLNGFERAYQHLPLTIIITGRSHRLSKGMLNSYQARHANRRC
jgi:hypothetical protein